MAGMKITGILIAQMRVPVSFFNVLIASGLVEINLFFSCLILSKDLTLIQKFKMYFDSPMDR